MPRKSHRRLRIGSGVVKEDPGGAEGPGNARGPVGSRPAGPRDAVRSSYLLFLLKASLRAFAGAILTTVLAAILMASPVAGLRPMRALRFWSFTAPRPPSGILPADLRLFITTSSTATNTALAWAFEIP